MRTKEIKHVLNTSSDTDCCRCCPRVQLDHIGTVKRYTFRRFVRDMRDNRADTWAEVAPTPFTNLEWKFEDVFSRVTTRVSHAEKHVYHLILSCTFKLRLINILCRHSQRLAPQCFESYTVPSAPLPPSTKLWVRTTHARLLRRMGEDSGAKGLYQVRSIVVDISHSSSKSF